MRIIALFAAGALLASGGAALAQSGSQTGNTGSKINNVGGETGIAPPKKAEIARAISRSGIDDTVGRMFRDGDGNRDGTITLAEFNSVATALKSKVIAERFQRIDTDGNGQLSAGEFSAWQLSIGAVALSGRLDGPPSEGLVAESLPIDYGRKDDVDFMSLVLEPLSATLIVSANTDYDSGASLAEVLDYEHGLFDKADLNHDGFITWDEADELRKKN